MTNPHPTEIPPAHREAVADAVMRAEDASPIAITSAQLADAAIATFLALGYRVAPGWVAWSHGQPNDGAMCLVYGAGEFFVAKYRATGMPWESYDKHHVYFLNQRDVTHWMPLPSPPTTPHHTTTDRGE